MKDQMGELSWRVRFKGADRRAGPLHLKGCIHPFFLSFISGPILKGFCGRTWKKHI